MSTMAVLKSSVNAIFIVIAMKNILTTIKNQPTNFFTIFKLKPRPYTILNIKLSKLQLYNLNKLNNIIIYRIICIKTSENMIILSRKFHLALAFYLRVRVWGIFFCKKSVVILTALPKTRIGFNYHWVVIRTSKIE